ncbi:hypothetical protein D3C75_704590 [compost metagenome]
MQATPGEKRLAGAGGVFAVQGGAEHFLQIAVLVLDQVVDRPAAQAILVRHVDFLQLRNGHAGVFVVQLGDDLQVGGQHTHFRGGAQFQFAAFVDVEWLVGAVGLHPHPRAVRGQFEQGEAVAYLGGAGGGQEAFADQADLRGKLRVGEFFQVLGGLALQLALQGAGGGEVKAVEVIQRTIEHAGQTAARDTDALVGFNRLNGRLGGPVAVDHFAGQGGGGELGVDHMVLRQQAYMAVGEVGQFIVTLGQVVRRAALGNHQRQHFTQGQAFFRHGFWIRSGAGQRFVGLFEVGAVPHAQPFSHAVHFTVARYS